MQQTHKSFFAAAKEKAGLKKWTIFLTVYMATEKSNFPHNVARKERKRKDLD